jgi:hypothetical protein
VVAHIQISVNALEQLNASAIINALTENLSFDWETGCADRGQPGTRFVCVGQLLTSTHGVGNSNEFVVRRKRGQMPVVLLAVEAL